MKKKKNAGDEVNIALAALTILLVEVRRLTSVDLGFNCVGEAGAAQLTVLSKFTSHRQYYFHAN